MTAPGGGAFSEARLTAHALESLSERGISAESLRRVLAEPDEWWEVRPGRVVCHGIVEERGREFLLRVFIDVDPPPGRIVTAYRTSKIEKYRRDP
ncbi:MAG: hypothetical protein AMXMBFR80_09370 [Dehalococcoidia bacterium]